MEYSHPTDCPRCGASGFDHIDYEHVEIDNGEAHQGASCDVCGARWTEVYVSEAIIIHDKGNDLLTIEGS